MKVKFIEVGAMGNQVFLTGDVAEVTDQTGQELIDKGYAEKAADNAKVTESPKSPSTAKTKAKEADHKADEKAE